MATPPVSPDYHNGLAKGTPTPKRSASGAYLSQGGVRDGMAMPADLSDVGKMPEAPATHAVAEPVLDDRGRSTGEWRMGVSPDFLTEARWDLMEWGEPYDWLERHWDRIVEVRGAGTVHPCVDCRRFHRHRQTTACPTSRRSRRSTPMWDTDDAKSHSKVRGIRRPAMASCGTVTTIIESPTSENNLVPCQRASGIFLGCG